MFIFRETAEELREKNPASYKDYHDMLPDYVAYFEVYPGYDMDVVPSAKQIEAYEELKRKLKKGDLYFSESPSGYGFNFVQCFVNEEEYATFVEITGFEENKFTFNRKYLKATERNKSNYSWDTIFYEFRSALKKLPVQKSLRWFSKPITYKNLSGEEIAAEEKICHNLYEQHEFIIESLLEDDGLKYKEFFLPYATLFFIMKNCCDEELSYLYTTGMKFITSYDDEFGEPEDLISEEYTKKIKRCDVIKIVSFQLVLKMLIDEQCYDFEKEFVLADFEKQ